MQVEIEDYFDEIKEFLVGRIAAWYERNFTSFKNSYDICKGRLL